MFILFTLNTNNKIFMYSNSLQILTYSNPLHEVGKINICVKLIVHTECLYHFMLMYKEPITVNMTVVY